MPSIGKFFANSKVSDWRSGSLGGGGGGLGAFSASGGNSTGTDGSYTWHKFTSSGTFTVIGGEKNVEVFVCAGGGGGSSSDFPSYPYGQSDKMANAGGGGGGYVEAVHHVSVNGGVSEDGAYSVTVGSGGSGGTVPSYGGYQGNPSKFDTVESIGGGGGSRGRNNQNPTDYSIADIGRYTAGGCGAAPSPHGTTSTPTLGKLTKTFNNINTNSAGLGSQGYGAGATAANTNEDDIAPGGGGGQGGLGENGNFYWMPWLGYAACQAGDGGAGRANAYDGTSTLYGGGGGSIGGTPHPGSPGPGSRGEAGPGGGGSGASGGGTNGGAGADGEVIIQY